jgi:predicted dehydrogenase
LLGGWRFCEEGDVDTIRLGYVGCGFMAQRVHLPNFLATPGCRVVALAELRPELGRKVATRLGIPKLYRSHEELIADA